MLVQVLDVISSAAGEIAGLQASASDAPPEAVSEPVTPLGLSNDGKTRRWALSSHVRAHAPQAAPNRFGAVAGEFFFPLMTRYDDRAGTLDMLNSDTVLPLGQLLCTLGAVLEAANNTGAHRTMAAALAEFLVAVRAYADEYIERCGMFALSRILLTCPRHELTAELMLEYLGELRMWVETIAHTSPSPMNKQCAATCLKLLGPIQPHMVSLG